MKQLVAFAVLIAAGCNKGQDPLDCASVIPGAIDRMMASARGELTPTALARVHEVAPKMKEAIVQVCRDDKWSPEVIDCHRIASTQADINICQRKLNATERAHTDKATQQVLEAFNSPGNAGSGPGVGEGGRDGGPGFSPAMPSEARRIGGSSAGSGSAATTGSAASGSAEGRSRR